MKRLGLLLLALLATPLLARAQDTSANVNSRYTVERVEITGVDETKISQKLRDELQALVGGHLDSKEAERLSHRLEAELPEFHVQHRMSRGSEAGKVVVVFKFTEDTHNWISVMSPRSKLIYHEDQGWSTVLDIGAGFGNQKFSAGFLFGNNDDLVEEYSGYRLRAETSKAVTRRLGLSFEYSDFSQEWKPETLLAIDASGNIPAAYRDRRIVDPGVTFALTPHFRLTAGASISTMDPLSGLGPSEHANAAIGSLGYDQTWGTDDGFRQGVSASYQFRAGTRTLGSDLAYDRHFGQVRYWFGQGHSTVKAELLVGNLTGRAPLFERFTLGDSSTLRGWNKYVLAPAGADRMTHQSLEYAYRHFAYFLDMGSVWDRGTDARVRLASGVGYHGSFFFMTLAVPLNADDVGLTFMTGIRAVSFGFGKR